MALQGTLTRGARRALTVGGVLACLVAALPMTRFVFGYLVILVHEFGHVTAGWAFGYPSVPAFDFAHGGGVTVHRDRSVVLIAALAIVLAAAIRHARHHPRVRTALIALGSLWAVAAFTPLHGIIVLMTGHAAELIIAGIFLYRAASGEAVRVPIERPLYAFSGFFILIEGARLALGLMLSHERRVEYELAKGGGAWMDLSRLSAEYLPLDLAGTAACLLIACLAVPACCLAALTRRVGVRSMMGPARDGAARDGVAAPQQ